MPTDADTIARIAYLVILLAGVGGYFFLARGRRIGRSLRDLLIWALIFAMVVIAYGFRDVLTGELFPGRAMWLSEDAIELRRGPDGHFHAELEIDGVTVRFIVDTGASRIVLSQEDAERIGIDMRALAFTGRAHTANGTVAIAPVRLDTVTLGPFIARNVVAAVNGGQLHHSLLGMDYLQHFARIEIEGDRMRLVR